MVIWMHLHHHTTHTHTHTCVASYSEPHVHVCWSVGSRQKPSHHCLVLIERQWMLLNSFHKFKGQRDAEVTVLLNKNGPKRWSLTREATQHVKNVAEKRWRDQVMLTRKREMTDTGEQYHSNKRFLFNKCIFCFNSRSWKRPILYQYFPWLTGGADSWASGPPRTCWWVLDMFHGRVYTLLDMYLHK